MLYFKLCDATNDHVVDKCWSLSHASGLDSVSVSVSLTANHLESMLLLDLLLTGRTTPLYLYLFCSVSQSSYFPLKSIPSAHSVNTVQRLVEAANFFVDGLVYLW